ncbi:MAG: MBL fold metallo-hydrolase [Actinomycetota bacterium]|nr:MBL fold metallo-hydrolase [Actinomycetota bacterium]
MTALETIHSTPGAEIHRLVVGPMDNDVYILRCTRTGQAVMIDAANEPELLLETARLLGVTRVLETHGHWDHVQAVPEMRSAGFLVGIGEADDQMVEGFDFLVQDGDRFEIGDLRLTAIHTPGHTPGSVCYHAEEQKVLFSGDTLFPGGPGNTSTPGGDFETIMDSLESRLFAALDDRTVVLPGHGAPTTIGDERPHVRQWRQRGW